MHARGGVPVDERVEEATAAAAEEMAAEQAALAAALEQLSGEQIVADTAVSLATAGLYYCGGEARPPRLADARVVIDALTGVVERSAGLPDELQLALRAMLSQAQMAFVATSQGAPGQPQPPSAGPEEPPPPPSRLWIPGR